MRRFKLYRLEDVSGFSKKSIIAEGCVFSNGKAIVSWLGKYASVVVGDSLDDCLYINGNDGKTAVLWID